jgi:MFS family permease
MIQGIGVGGEWGGSVLLAMEWARTHGHRGFVASWPQFGVPCGLFLANLAVLAFSQMSGDQFNTWGWRIPFALSIVLVGVGLWIRLGILETPVFQKLLHTKKIEKAPIIEVFKKHPKEIILSALSRVSEQAPFYIFTAFIFAYAVGTLHMSRDLILIAVLVAACLSFVRSHWAQKDVYDRCGDGRVIRLSIFRHGRHRDSVGGVHRDCPVAYPP